MKQLHGRTAVITGAASGFGLEVARLAAQQGDIAQGGHRGP
jgi:NAD(P)-dependent dehydrogenase (short-subunit alcohol dehydrogenase family)